MRGDGHRPPPGTGQRCSAVALTRPTWHAKIFGDNPCRMCGTSFGATIRTQTGRPLFGSLVRSLVGWTWTAHDLPRHLQHFRESSIRRAAARAGLLVSDLETESLPEHVEGELVGWLRRRLTIPARLTQWSHATFPLASYLADRGNASGRGESIVAHLRPDGR
jgi:hypothetical protein